MTEYCIYFGLRTSGDLLTLDNVSMEHIIQPSDDPDDKYFVQCLKQERYARNVFSMTKTEPLLDQVICSTPQHLYFYVPWFDKIAANLFHILKPMELKLFKGFLSDEYADANVQLYCFMGKSCAKHHLRTSWLFKNRIDCVEYEMRCLCISFPSIESVLEIHTSRRELFQPANYKQYSVWLQSRYVSTLQRSKEKLDSLATTNIGLNQTLIGLFDSHIQHGRLQLVCGRNL